jgi:Fic-DOC domain mobile mystery protein B
MRREDLIGSGPANTPLSGDELLDLIPDLTTKQELNEWERENILVARKWALSPRNLKHCDPFSEEFVRKLHYRMFDRTWNWAGTYRKTEKNIGVKVFQIRECLVNLLEDAKFWLKEKMETDELAIRFHHKLVLIHAFPNGNGRHARLIADVVLAKVGAAAFSWGFSDTVPISEIRSQYIKALKEADDGNLKNLVLFARSGASTKKMV